MDCNIFGILDKDITVEELIECMEYWGKSMKVEEILKKNTIKKKNAINTIS